MRLRSEGGGCENRGRSPSCVRVHNPSRVRVFEQRPCEDLRTGARGQEKTGLRAASAAGAAGLMPARSAGCRPVQIRLLPGLPVPARRPEAAPAAVCGAAQGGQAPQIPTRTPGI